MAWIVSWFLIGCEPFRTSSSRVSTRVIQALIEDPVCGLQFNLPSNDLTPRPARKTLRPEKGCEFSLALTCMRHSNSFLFCWNSIRFSNHYRVETQCVIAVETQQGGVLPFLRRSSLDYLHIMLHTCLSKFMWFGWFDFAKIHMVANKSKVNAAICLNPWSFKTSTRVFQHVIIFMPIDFGLFAYNIWIMPFEIHVRCVFLHGLDDIFLQKSTTLSFSISTCWSFWFNLFSSCGGYL